MPNEHLQPAPQAHSPLASAWRHARWLLVFAASLLATVGGSHYLSEWLGLRYCQPLRYPNSKRVLYYQHSVRNADVVYLGDSQMYRGVMPNVVAEEAASHGCPLPIGYNLSLEAAPIELHWILTRDVLKGDKLPRILVLQVTPRLLAAGVRNKRDHVYRYASLRDIRRHVRADQAPASMLLTASFRGLENLLQYPLLYVDIDQRDKTCEWRLLPHNRGSAWLPEDEQTTQPPTDEEWLAKLEKYRSQSRTFKYRDDSEEAAWLLAIRKVAAERGMKLVLIYPPQHPDLYQSAYINDTEVRFRSWIAEFVRAKELKYHDLSCFGEFSREEFQDPTHLNARGAARFSRRLAEVLIAAEREPAALARRN